MRQLPLSIGLALLAEMIALVISDEPLLAVLLALATLALFWRARDWHRRRLKLSALTTTIAVMLTTAGVFRFVTFGGGSSGSATSRARKADSQAQPATQSANGNGLDGWAGVILIPDVKQQKHVILVPPLPSMNKDIFTKPDDNPLTIPFYGVYWVYRFPALRSPPQSPTLHETPEDIRFRSQGLVPLTVRRIDRADSARQ